MARDLSAYRAAWRAGGPELGPRLVELLEFRHVYGNLHSFDQRGERVREPGLDVLAVWPDLRAALGELADALDAMARA
jgi:hypothetical protein